MVENCRTVEETTTRGETSAPNLNLKILEIFNVQDKMKAVISNLELCSGCMPLVQHSEGAIRLGLADSVKCDIEYHLREPAAKLHSCFPEAEGRDIWIPYPFSPKPLTHV